MTKIFLFSIAIFCLCLIPPATCLFPGQQGKKNPKKINFFGLLSPTRVQSVYQKLLAFTETGCIFSTLSRTTTFFILKIRSLVSKTCKFLFFFSFNSCGAWNQDSNKITWVLLFSDVIQLQKLHIMFVSFRQQKWIFLLLSLTKYQIFYQHLLEIVKTTRFFYFKKTQLGCQQILNFFSSLFLCF